jgi:capsular polysaccharide biosynthesis protein
MMKLTCGDCPYAVEWRRVILITTLVAAIAAFVVSFWFLPRTYQATAYVFIGQPAVEFSKSQTESGFKISSTLPDLNAVVKLSTAPKLLESVLRVRRLRGC